MHILVIAPRNSRDLQVAKACAAELLRRRGTQERLELRIHGRFRLRDTGAGRETRYGAQPARPAPLISLICPASWPSGRIGMRSS